MEAVLGFKADRGARLAAFAPLYILRRVLDCRAQVRRGERKGGGQLYTLLIRVNKHSRISAPPPCLRACRRWTWCP
jgi:hypothetical protein